MKIKAKRRLLHDTAVICVLLCTASALTLPASADEPYDVYNYNYLGEAVPSQAGYLAERAISGIDLGTTPLDAPSDLFKDESDAFYLVDSGNNRILKINSAFDEIIQIYDSFTMPDGSETTLNHPKGVYVSPDSGLMYIADHENMRALVCQQDGKIIMEITKPESTAYDQQLAFLPQKILCDNAGNIYIVLNNTTKGAAMFDADGNFIGYYGANTIARTATVIANYFWNAIASEEEKRYRARSVPTAFDNFDIDPDKGFIYTSTSSGSSETDIVKKVNPEGYNLFGYMSDYTWGDLFSTWYSGTNYKTKIVDIDIGDDGSINCLDAATGRVFQYDKEADLLFIMGTLGDQVGAFTQGSVSAVETKGERCENIYVLDAGKGTVTVFEQTGFGGIVHDATQLYNAGYYEEALEPWLEVLKRDGNYRRAYLGISSAYYNMGRYQESMEYAKKADASGRYNRAFERYRSQWLRAHLTTILLGIVLLTACIWGIKFWLKKRRDTNATTEKGGRSVMMDFTQPQWVKHVIFHPFEGFEDLRWKKGGTLKYTIFIIAALFFALIANDRWCGFQFRPLPDAMFSVVPYIMRSAVYFLAWVIGNWAVCTLLDGEGTMKNIAIYSSYALIPYIVQMFVQVILSHILVRDEIVFFDTVYYVGVIWTVLLLFQAVKAVHQYSFTKTIAAIILTLCAMLIILFLAVLFLSLFQKVYVFFYSLYTEILYRVRV